MIKHSVKNVYTVLVGVVLVLVLGVVSFLELNTYNYGIFRLYQYGLCNDRTVQQHRYGGRLS